MQKALTNSSMLPSCNGAMMRNIYQQASAQAQAQASSRGYQYAAAAAAGGGGHLGSMGAGGGGVARYPPMGTPAGYPGMSNQAFGMPHSSPVMTRQDAEPDTTHDWYNKGFSALRMNNAPHNHANLPGPMLQYQT